MTEERPASGKDGERLFRGLLKGLLQVPKKELEEMEKQEQDRKRKVGKTEKARPKK